MSAYVVTEDWSAGSVLRDVLYVAHAVTFADARAVSLACVQSEFVKSLSRSFRICVHCSASNRASFVSSCPMKCDCTYCFGS